MISRKRRRRLRIGPGNWYGVTVTYKSIRSGRKRHLWERDVFVVRAKDEDAAREETIRIAREGELQYLNGDGETVRWVLQEIENIVELFDNEIRPGTQIMWEFFERVDKEPAFLRDE